MGGKGGAHIEIGGHRPSHLKIPGGPVAGSCAVNLMFCALHSW